jgi:cobalt-zinc-cadmium efflux system membrane fusion protein
MTFDKTGFAGVAFIVAIAAGAIACDRQTAEEVESETPVAVKTAPAALGDVRGVIHATGIVNPAPGADLVVIAPETARVLEISHAVGDRVRRGDVLVRFETPGPAADVQRQQAELNRARTTLENARFAQTRARELFERGVGARREVEDATRAVADAEAAVAEAQASLGAAQAVAGRATVRATFDGIVAKRQHNPGDLVEPTASDAVLRIVDPRRIELTASVPLADASRIEVGAPAHLVDTSPDVREVVLKVLSRPAAVESGTATVPVRLGFGAPVTIPVGAPAQVDIEAEQHKGVVVVPAAAIVREGDETAVFVANGAKAQRRAVETGITDGAHVEIVSGIKPGEMVIVDGQAGLPNDAAITIANDSKSAKDEPK